MPKLPFGTYCIVASANPDLAATLCLNFSPGDVGKDGLFSMELKEAHFIQSREQMLASDEQLPITEISAFRGVVQDQTGAYVPKVAIAVTNMTGTGERHTIHLHSDAKGRFAAKLPDGDYIATFGSPGFAIGVLHLSISRTQAASDLKVQLKVGEATQ